MTDPMFDLAKESTRALKMRRFWRPALFLVLGFLFITSISARAAATTNAGGSLTIGKSATPKGSADFSFFLSRFHSKWGSPGSEGGQFLFPEGTAVDAQGNNYVADVNNSRIQKFAKNGTLLLKWGSTGSGDGQFDNPVGVAVDAQGNVFVADRNNHRIQKFDKTGSYLTQWGGFGDDDSQFASPSGIAVGPQGHIFVADRGNHRIQVFENDGAFMYKWGQNGSGNKQFGSPVGVALDSTGNVYVSERFNHRIQKFNHGGVYIGQWGSAGSGDSEFNEPYGIAVGAQGDIFVADTGNHRIQRFDKDGTFLAEWGSEGSAEGQFMTPSGVAVDTEGNIYVAERFNHRLQRFLSSDFLLDNAVPDDGDANGSLITFDELAPGEHLLVERTLSKWTLEDLSCKGDVQSPVYVDLAKQTATINLTADEDIVCTFQNESLSSLTFIKSTSPQDGRDFLFDFIGPNYPDPLNFLAEWGSPGSGDSQFNSPYGVAVGKQEVVYVVDTFNYRIQMFDKTGAYLGQWGSQGPADGELNQPWGIAVDAQGTVYVTDSGNRRIQKFDKEGGYLAQWGSQGSGDGQFINPYGIALDVQGNIYVADSGNHRIQKFDKAGAYLSQWGSSGDGDGQFNSPSGLAIDAKGNVYVADSENHRIQKFNQEGGYLGQWGSQGTGDGQFYSISDLAFDANGFVYVTDKYNHRIQKFDSAGNYIAQWGGFGSSDGHFERPFGIALNPSGHIFVVDSANMRVQAFLPGGFVLDDPGADDGDTFSKQISFDSLPVGTYQVKEQAVAAWSLEELSCSGAYDSQVNVNLANRRATIDLAAGEDLICTFVNRQLAPLLTAIKQDTFIVDENDDGIANPGDRINYEVIIENSGVSDAESLIFTDYVVSGSSLRCGLPATPSTSQGAVSGCTAGTGGNLRIDAGDLAGGEQVTIAFEVTVNEDASGIAVCNQGQVTADNHAEVRTDDPDLPGSADVTCTPLENIQTDFDIYLPIIKKK